MQDLFEIKKELVIFLRNSNIVSISNRGVSTETDTGTFSSDSTHTLGTNPTLAKNVRSVVVAAVTLTQYTDYTVNYDTGVISFTSPQSGSYTISYDQGSSDSIFPDFPQANLKLSAFPRIAVDIIDSTMVDADIGAVNTHFTYDISITNFSAGTEELDDMASDVISNMLANKRSFNFLKYIRPTRIGPTLNSPGKGDKIIMKAVDFRSVFNYQIG